MKYLKLFENFDNSEVENRMSENDNLSDYDLENLIKDAYSILSFMKERSTVDILNLLNYIQKNNLEDKQIPSVYGGYSKSPKSFIYLYLLYLINMNRLDVLNKLDQSYIDNISGKISEREKENLLIWLEKSKKIDNKKPFFDLLDTININNS
jgi:hypothetical protein